MRELLAVLAVLTAACAPSASPGSAPPTEPAPATPGVPVAAQAAGVRPDGFDLAAARVTAADGEVCELCVWLADTPLERSRGLMEVTDLGPAQAMAFVYPTPTTTTFWMLNTPLPLSIAYFDAAGAFLDAYDMEPCRRNPCPSYATAPQFTVAVEVPQGGLADLLIGPGSTLELLDLPCA